MWNDVLDLRDFYSTGRGLTARRLLRLKLRQMWPKLAGERVLGFGYPVPYLGLWQSEAERAIAIMPAEQGVLHWPSDGPNATALSDETHMPLPDRSIDRVMTVRRIEPA